MDRCAVFVDAGYLLAGGGLVCCGTKKRAEIVCDYPAVTQSLADVASRNCGFAVLRIYWYDAAPDAIPLPDHLKIAHLPNIKLRLGRLSGGEQKGVDSLIVRDLMTLARERAVATAYLLSGDEDLREGVVAAQDMGVRVVLLGIPSSPGTNQAATLVRESDEHVVLSQEFWQDHFSRREAVEVSEAPKEANEDAALAVGERLASEWLDAVTPEEMRELRAKDPVIPSQLDIQLIKKAEESLGSLRERPDLKRTLRRGFWKAITAQEAGKEKGPRTGAPPEVAEADPSAIQ